MNDAIKDSTETRPGPPPLASALLSVTALLGGTGLLLLGGGLYGTLLPVRGAIEGFTPTSIAMIMAIYYVGFVAGTSYSVRLIENVGHIRVYAALSGIASAATLAHVVFLDPVAWGVLRGITGLCFAGLYMIVESWLSERSTTETRGRILSAYMIVNLGAIALGQFFLLAAPAESFALFTAVSILISLATVPISLSRAPAPAVMARPRAKFRQLINVSPLGTAGCLAAGVAGGAWWSLAPAVFYTVYQNETRVAFLMAATILGGLAGQFPVGRLSDHFDRRKVLIWITAAAAVAALANGLALGGNFPLMLVVAVIFGSTQLCVYALGVAHVNDFRGDMDMVSLAGALLLLYGIGAALGGAAAGLAIEIAGPRGLFWFVAAVGGGLAGFGALRAMRRPPVPADEQGEHVLLYPGSTQLGPEEFEAEEKT